jgi:hypothetical protein
VIKGSGGVFVRTGFGPAGGTDHPDGYLAQIHPGPGPSKTGGLLRPLTGKSRPETPPSRPGPPAGEWFDLDVIAVGPTVRVLVNGQETARADGPTARPGGRIALQVHDPDTVIEVASVAVKELPRPVAPAAAPRAHDRSAGRWRVDGDELVQESATGYTFLTFGDPNWSDYDFTCDVKRTGGAHEVYLKYRLGPSGEEVFGLGGWANTEDYATSAPLGKRWRQRRDPSAGVPSDEWVAMRVKVRGGRCECYRGGKLRFDYADPVGRKGAVGIGTFATTARFKNIRVSDPAGNPLWAGPPELPTPVGKAAGPAAPADGFVPLFTGKDLTGWAPGDPNPNWVVSDGALVNSSRGTMLTEKTYSDFTLKFEFRVTADTMASIDLWSIPGDRPNWVFLDNTRDAMAAITWDAREKGFAVNRLNPRAELRPDGEWNQMTIDLRNCILSVTLNGRQLGRADIRKHVEDRRQELPAGERLRGRIGLTKWGGKGTISIRNVSIRVPE